MTSKRSTTKETEADLEARIRAAIKCAFPLLPDGAIKHQIKFSFKFGRQNIEVDYGKTRAEARLDILLEMDNKPLAVLELKRPGVTLAAEDGEQGLSYARLVQPPAPLVLVTNGSDVSLLETHTGAPWEPAEKSEAAFKTLMTQASRVASEDLRHAIDTLMGTSPKVWMQAVRRLSEETVEELTASWNDPALPFIEDFLTPRLATHKLMRRLLDGQKLLILEGRPLSGKSNVLRELCLYTTKHEHVAVLYVEAGVGSGALQAIADALNRSLNWPVSPQEARDWLIRISHAENEQLVLAFDGLEVSDLACVREIEDLSSGAFGPSLGIIVAMDEAVSQRLIKTPNGRSASVLGRRSNPVHVEALSDKEFSLARDLLARRRMYLMAGSDMAPEYREPWVLRAVAGNVQLALRSRSEDHALSVPPMLGLQLIKLVRQRFQEDPELRRRFRALACAMVSDVQDATRPPDYVLQQLENGVIRRGAVSAELGDDDIKWLHDHGFVRPSMHDVVGPTLLVRLPELLASETAQVLADELLERANTDLSNASRWVAGISNNLPLGEIVAAQAIIDASTRHGGLPTGIIQQLLDTPPSKEVLHEAQHFMTMLPGGAMLDITIDADGKGTAVLDGTSYEIDLGDEERVAYNNLAPWLILSHVASVRFETAQEGKACRDDPSLLLTIGSCPLPLRAGRGPSSLREVLTVDLPGDVSVLHFSAGIVEPITLGIFSLLAEEPDLADSWIASAVSTNSIALLTRVDTALRTLVNLKTHARSQWAQQQLKDTVQPSIRAFLANIAAIRKKGRGEPAVD